MKGSHDMSANTVSLKICGASPARPAMRLLAVLLSVLCLWGCATVRSQTRKVVEAIPFTGERLQKKVAILPVENTTFISDAEITQRFMSRFMDRLSAGCNGVQWLKPGDPGYPDEAVDRMPRPASGRIDNLALAEIGRTSGINAFLVGHLVGIDAEEKDEGFFIFRDTHYYESVQVGLQLYDSGTGAKLMDESPKATAEVDGAEYDAVLARDLKAVYALDETLDRVAEIGAAQICEVLGKHPWQGYVLAVQDGKAILSSGREIGLKAGDILEVYNAGEVIEGRMGQRFIIPGTLAGTLEITAVDDGRAEARPIDATPVAEGAAVRLK